MRFRNIIILICGLSLAACATGPATLYVKQGVDRETYDAESEVCSEAIKQAQRGNSTPYIQNTTGTVGGAAATGAAAGFMKGMEDARIMIATLDGCMTQHGYRQVVLSEEEEAEIDAIKDKEERRDSIFELVTSGLPDALTKEEYKALDAAEAAVSK